MTTNKPIPSSADRALMPTSAPAPAICLVKPQMGENIGAAARAMANFGLEELHIVNPRDGWPNEKAIAVAASATWVVEKAQIHATTNDALAEKNIVFATSGTPRQLDKPLISPQEAVKIAAQAMAKGQKPIILFGNERFGLDQIDLVSADYIVTYPTDFRCPSLNLAQSVAVFSYLWAIRDGEKLPEGWDLQNDEIAPRKYFDNLFDFLIKELDECGFFWPQDRRENMVENLRNSLVRAKFSESEINLFRGALRVIAEGPRRRFIEAAQNEKRKKIAKWLEENYQFDEILQILIEKNQAIAIIKMGANTHPISLMFENETIKVKPI